jgi:hypothetical protein
MEARKSHRNFRPPARYLRRSILLAEHPASDVNVVIDDTSIDLIEGASMLRRLRASSRVSLTFRRS